MNPLEQTFEEHKMHMEEVFEGVFKRIVKPAPASAKPIDFSRHRVTYHRNFFMENEPAPFDSTYLNGKPDVICNDIDDKLTGFCEALSTMKAEESAIFIISYKKMFGEKGCVPRVQPNADILAEMKVLSVEEIGDYQKINKINEDMSEIKSFEEAKELTKEARLRAKDYFSNDDVGEAVKMYQKIIQMLNFAKFNSEEAVKERDELLVQVLLNLVTCFNRQEKPDKALAQIGEIEKKTLIENEPKILYAKGKALRMLGDLHGASMLLKKALLLRPNDKILRKELEKLDANIADYNDMNKKLAANLFIKD